MKKFNFVQRIIQKVFVVLIMISMISTLLLNVDVRKVAAVGSINFDEYMAPFWSTETMYNESVLMVGNDSGSAEATLLFSPLQIVSVKSSDLNTTYVQGVDWVYQNGKLKLLSGSRAPYMTPSELYPTVYDANHCWDKVGGGYIYCDLLEQHVMHDKQLAVTYTHSKNVWQGPVPQFSGASLPNTMAKLKDSSASLKIVFYGDSITKGLSASGVVGGQPNMPCWADLFAQKLQSVYPGNISYYNAGAPGKDTSYGVQNVQTSVVAQNPDLVVLAWGMNDGINNFGNPLSPSAYKNNILSMMNSIKAARPNCEFILVATMLANAETLNNGNQASYKPELQSLTGNGVVMLDMTGIHQELLKIKPYRDMTGNNINHPNDFLVRWYAQGLSSLLIPQGSVNVALNKTVNSSTSVENYGWYRTRVVDGRNASSTGAVGWSSATGNTSNHTEWVSVDLGSSYFINKVSLYPRNDSGCQGMNFPIDFTIQTSMDNVNWTTVVTKTNYPKPVDGAGQIFQFNGRLARYVKVVGTNLRQDGGSDYLMQLSEIEVYLDVNMALNKTTTASSSVEGYGWSLAKVVDGQINTLSGSYGWSSATGITTNHTEWLSVDLGSPYMINKVVLYPRNDSGCVGGYFPVDFTIKVSTDNLNWSTVVTKTNYPIPIDGAPQVFQFPTNRARYVKVEGTNLTKLSGIDYMMEFAEIEVYQETNLAVDKSVSSSSSIENWGWFRSKLVDGQNNSLPGTTMGWSSNTGITANHTEWITVNLGSSYTINEVILYPRNDSGCVGMNFPINFTVKVSTDNINWTTVVTQTNYPIPSDTAQVFTFSNQAAKYVKVEGTSLRHDGGSDYLMQLAEIAIYQP